MSFLILPTRCGRVGELNSLASSQSSLNSMRAIFMRMRAQERDNVNFASS